MTPIYETFINHSCSANVPLYILNAKPIIINIDKYNEDLDEEEELYTTSTKQIRMIAKSNSKTKTITFTMPVDDLLKLKRGNKIKIAGSLINSSETYTIVKNPTKNVLVLLEEIPYFKMKSGIITITFSGINESEQLLIFDKQKSMDRLNNIDGLTTINEQQINKVDILKNDIVAFKRTIGQFENLIENYEDKIDKNKSTMLKNKMMVNTKSDYLKHMNNAIEQQLEINENTNKSFIEKYKQLEFVNSNLEKKNIELNMSILNSKQKISELNNNIHNNEKQILIILNELPETNDEIKENRDMMDIHDKNYYDFQNRCKVFTTHKSKSTKNMQCKYIQ
jgi:hypothetical protein